MPTSASGPVTYPWTHMEWQWSLQCQL